MNGEPDVFEVVEGTLTVPGVGTMPVSGFTLTLQHNGIPTLQAAVDPLHTSAWYKRKIAKPAAVSVETLIERYNKLQQTVNSEQRECSFNFELKNDRLIFDRKRQELKLRGWLLTGVGLSSTADGGLSMSVEIRHPAHKLVENTANMFGLKVEEVTDPEEFTSATNVYEGILVSMQKYYTLMQSGTVEPVKNDADFKKMLEDYSAAREAISRHLEWDAKHGNWPSRPFSEFEDEIKYAMWSYVNATGDDTYWAWLSSRICNDWHVSILPTYWKERLLMTPNRYWARPDLELRDTVLMDFELPPADPMPLKGIYTFCDSPEFSMDSLFNDAQGMKFSLANAAIWSEKQLRGAYKPLITPAWFNGILGHRGGMNSNVTEPGAMISDGRLLSPLGSTLGPEDLGRPPVEDMESLWEGAKLMCKQQFTELYRSRMEISVRTNLLIQTDSSQLEDGRVTAGQTVRLKPDSTFMGRLIGRGSPLLDFFVTEVTHFVDCQQPAAHTMIRGSFMRESAGGPKNVQSIPGGKANNYLYE